MIVEDLKRKKEELSRVDFLRYALYRIALETTNNANLNMLEERFFDTSGIVRAWIFRGHVPGHRALELEKKTGITGLAAILH